MPKKLFLIEDITPGKLNAMVKNLMSQMKIKDPGEAVRLLNSGRWKVVQVTPSLFLRSENGAIYLNVTSYGIIGDDWLSKFGKKHFSVDPDFEKLLESGFKPTKKLTQTVVLVSEKVLFPNGIEDNDPDHYPKIICDGTKNFLAKTFWKAAEMTTETICLISEVLTPLDYRHLGFGSIVFLPQKDLSVNGEKGVVVRRRWISVTSNLKLLNHVFAFALTTR